MTCSACGAPLAVGAQTCAACGTPVLNGGMPATSVSQRIKPVLTEEKTINPVRTNDVLLKRYRLEDKVGEGGMGAVFVAHDLELDRKVAVKLLAASLVNDAEVLERFEREARLMAKLDHPHLVPVYDVGRHEGRPFIVMKLLQGDSLAGLLRAKGGFTADETVKLMRQLAAGLDYIHKQGFIHRDIKAGNIFVSPEGHATILDFGILRPKSASTGITRTGMVMGTPHYMAPEQALGHKDVDHRVDLYALAVVLFECLTGTLPFEADSELRLIQLQAHAPPPEVVERAPWIPPSVAQVMKRALAKRPEDRFNTAAELIAALDAAYLVSKSAKQLQAVTGPAPALSATTAPSLRKLESQPPVVVTEVEKKEPDTNELNRAVQRGRPLLAMSVLLGLMLAAGGWFFRDALFPAEVPVVVDAGVAVVEVVIDAGAPVEEVDAGTGFADFPEPDAGPALAVVEEDPGVEAEVDAGTALVKKQPTPKRKGQMNVISTHDGEPYWAQVSIDGVMRGRTPLLLDLPVGKYQVRVERTGFRPTMREVKIAGGKSVVVKVELVQR